MAGLRRISACVHGSGYMLVLLEPASVSLKLERPEHRCRVHCRGLEPHRLLVVVHTVGPVVVVDGKVDREDVGD